MFCESVISVLCVQQETGATLASRAGSGSTSGDVTKGNARCCVVCCVFSGVVSTSKATVGPSSGSSGVCCFGIIPSFRIANTLYFYYDLLLETATLQH